jgi:hypothetical protein
MLESSSVDAAAKLFAATTLKGKVRWPRMRSCFLPDRARSSTTFTKYHANSCHNFESLS